MGWRSWNGLGGDVNQTIMEAQMRAMVARRHTVDGKPTSLLDLGYTSIGLDDGWELCVNGTFHDPATGAPMVNTQLFPDMAAMNELAHSLGLSSGWYMNPCGCNEGSRAPHYDQDAKALAALGYDGVKVDSCGPSGNMSSWAAALAATGRPMTAGVENCRNYEDVPGIYEGTDPPFTMFRSTEDNSPDWLSIMANLWTNARMPGTGGDPHGGLPVAHAGLYAYPDMLELVSGGCSQDLPAGTCGQQNTTRRVGGLTLNMSRAHFGAWAIVSSPLILGHVLSDDAAYDAAWPIVSNKAAIAVNQAMAGDMGRLVSQARTNISGFDAYHGRRCECVWANQAMPQWTLWAKTLATDGSRVAVLAINVGLDALPAGSISVPMSSVQPGASPASSWTQVDVWTGDAAGTLAAGQPWSAPFLAGESSFFAVLTASSRT